MSKVNVTCHNNPFHERLGSHTLEWFEAHHVSTAWNQMESISTSQVGGVAIFMVNKWMYQVDSSGCDSSGLGQWTWTRFRGKNGHHTRIVTCYWPVHNVTGPLLAYNQHHHFFLHQNVDSCPLQQFMVDLKTAIEIWQAAGDFLIIGGNWNEEVSSLQWREFWHQLGLVTLEGLITSTPMATYD